MSSDIIRRVAVCISACAFAAIDPVPALSQAATSPAGGVASASLCADAYVLTLMEPEDIRALSWQVGHPVSAAPDWARDWPQAWPDAERILHLSPDVTVFGTGEGGRTADVLRRAGHQSVELGWASDFAGVSRNLEQLGGQLRRSARASELVADQRRRLSVLEQRSALRSSSPRIVYLSASGGSAGAGTYIDAAIRAAGGINVMAEAGVSGWTRSDPEFALEIEADLLLTSFFADGFVGRFNRAQFHAAYRPLLAEVRRVDIPSGDWPCAGPRLIHAAERIADAIDLWALEREEDGS